jgi:hypothetical protein
MQGRAAAASARHTWGGQGQGVVRQRVMPTMQFKQNAGRVRCKTAVMAGLQRSSSCHILLPGSVVSSIYKLQQPKHTSRQIAIHCFMCVGPCSVRISNERTQPHAQNPKSRSRANDRDRNGKPTKRRWWPQMPDGTKQQSTSAALYPHL